MGIFRRKSSGAGPVRPTVGRPRARFTVDVPPEITGALRAMSIAPRISRREALQVPAVLRARNLICGTLCTLPLKLHNPDRTVRPWALFEQPDPDMPTSVVWAQTYEDLFFESMAWWRVTSRFAPAGPGLLGWPATAQYVPFESVHVVPDRPVGMQDWVSRDITIPEQGGRTFVDGVFVPDQDLIRFDSPNPPLLIHAARAIRTCLRLDDTASRFADEPIGAGYFESAEPGVDPFEDAEDSDASVQAFLNDWAASRRLHAWGWIPPGVKLGGGPSFSPRDLQLADARQHAVLEIARASGIHPEDLGVSVVSRVYANSEQRRQDLIDFTLAPFTSAVQDRLSMKDVSPRGSRARIKFDGFLRSDTKTRMETYKTGLEVDAYTPEEIRELEDKPALSPAEQIASADRRAPAPAEPPALPAREEVPA